MGIPDFVTHSIVYLADSGFVMALPDGPVLRPDWERSKSYLPYSCIVTARHVAERIANRLIIHANSWEPSQRLQEERERYNRLVGEPSWRAFSAYEHDNVAANKAMREAAEQARIEHGYAENWQESFDITERRIEIVVDSPQWHFHPSDNPVDLAVLPFTPPREIKPDDCGFIPYTMLPPRRSTTLDEGRPRSRRRSALHGATVHLVGLLAYYPGENRVLPIVRTGNVALVPDDRIATERGDAQVFLIEIRSIGGLSGSPVILPIEDHERGSRYSLLGVCSGHIDLPLYARDDPAPINQIYVGDTIVNMGLAYVQPARKLIEILDTEELLAMRPQRKQETGGSFGGGVEI